MKQLKTVLQLVGLGILIAACLAIFIFALFVCTLYMIEPAIELTDRLKG